MEKIENIPFGFVDIGSDRQTKPRINGLTMMMDWGVGLDRVRDHLDLVGQYVDFAKMVVGTSRLYTRQMLVRKLNLYKEYQIQPFLGGQFTEFAIAVHGTSEVEKLFREARELGFSAIEISDNCVPLDNQQREYLIKTVLDCDLEVHSEIGSKKTHQAPEKLIEQASISFRLGCNFVLVEGAELVHSDGSPNEGLIHTIKEQLPIDKILFELTGPWIYGTSLWRVYQLKKFLVDQFGVNVNLANVMPDDIMETEALRVGLSVGGPPN
jgi:phosphosulfolactate synthase